MRCFELGARYAVELKASSGATVPAWTGATVFDTREKAKAEITLTEGAVRLGEWEEVPLTLCNITDANWTLGLQNQNPHICLFA